MAAPTISQTRQDLRQRISRRIDDIVTGTVSGGTAGTGATNGTATAIGDIERYPTSPAYFIGAEITHIDTSDVVQSRSVTAHSFSDPTVTLTIAGTWTAPTSGDEYEIHRIGGRGFTFAQYNDAINAAIDTLADSYFTDSFAIPWAIEAGNNVILPRHEYPMPSGYNYIYAVDYLDQSPMTHNRLGNADTYRALGDATARTRLFQGFKVNQTGYYGWVVVAMNKVGSPTDNLTIQIHGDSSGVPDGTALTYGTSDTVDGSTLDEQLRYVVFRFDPPVFLTSGTQYHLVFVRSTAVNATNYYRLAEDDDDNYADGTAGTYDAVTYTGVTGSDFCFAVFRHSDRWISFKQRRSGIAGWEYRRIGTDFIWLPYLPRDMVPIRLRGLTAIAEVTTETATVPIRPEWVEAFAVDFLLSGRTGKTTSDTYAQGAREWARQTMARPRPTRPLPHNAIRIFA